MVTADEYALSLYQQGSGDKNMKYWFNKHDLNSVRYNVYMLLYVCEYASHACMLTYITAYAGQKLHFHGAQVPQMLTTCQHTYVHTHTYIHYMHMQDRTLLPWSASS